MARKHIATELEVTREEMIELLNEDLTREFEAIISYTSRELEKHAGMELENALKIVKQITDLGGQPEISPRTVKTSNDMVAMLSQDLEHERESAAHFRRRICQAEAMCQPELKEVLHEIVEQKQNHEADLCDALGIIRSDPAST